LNIENFIRDLGVDAESRSPLKDGVKNKVVGWMQDQKYTVEGKEHTVTSFLLPSKEVEGLMFNRRHKHNT
jgi:hypothetical protein